MKKMPKKILAFVLTLSLLNVHVVNAEVDNFQYKEIQNMVDVFEVFNDPNTEMVLLENTIGVNSELFESFERFILEQEFFTMNIEGFERAQPINASVNVFAVQMEALQTLDAMGIKDVSAWLEETTVEAIPGIVLFNPETGEERHICDYGEITTLPVPDIETMALQQRLVAPWTTTLPSLDDYLIATRFNDSRFQRVTTLQTFPYSAVVELIATAHNGQRFGGSGFIVRHPRHQVAGGGVVLTAAHNLFNPDVFGGNGWARSVEVITSTGAIIPWHTFGVDSRWHVNPRNFEWDMGAVSLGRNHPSYLSLTTQQGLPTSASMMNATVRNVGFPGQRVAQPWTMHRSSGIIGHVTANRRQFVSTTAPAGGMSGGPVLQNNRAWGIHVTENAALNSTAVTICQQFLDRLAFNM
jgi:V8-like Glu-specific endopeptidase